MFSTQPQQSALRYQSQPPLTLHTTENIASASQQTPIKSLELPSFPTHLHPAVSFGDDTTEEKADGCNEWDNAADVLYHDILIHVFASLDDPSLAFFTEMARLPNFESNEPCW
jgi:hypothetical protein